MRLDFDEDARIAQAHDPARKKPAGVEWSQEWSAAKRRWAGPKGRGLTLELFLCEHIDLLARGGVRPSQSGNMPDRAYDLAAEVWFAGRSKDSLPRAAVVRWFRPDGKSDAVSFASQPLPFPLVTESRLARRFPSGGLLRSAVVTARALKDIADVL